MRNRPSRIDLLELDIDLRLTDLWREAAGIEEWSLEVVAAFMRAAYGKGYCDALTEELPGSLCADHGYRVPERQHTGAAPTPDTQSRQAAGVVACVGSDAPLAKLDCRMARSRAIRRGSSSHCDRHAARGVPRLHRAQRHDARAATEQPRRSRGQGLADRQGKGPSRATPTAGGLRFRLHNINGQSPVIPIVYHGSVPDLFQTGAT